VAGDTARLTRAWTPWSDQYQDYFLRILRGEENNQLKPSHSSEVKIFVFLPLFEQGFEARSSWRGLSLTEG
jgi:hypothetical protein